MKKTILATILIILVFASLVGITGSALADTYVYTGLGGGGTPLSIATNGTNVFVGMNTGHIWKSDGGTNWTDTGQLNGTHSVTALVYANYHEGESTFKTIYAGLDNGETYHLKADGSEWLWTGNLPAYPSPVVTSLAQNGGQYMNVYAGGSNGDVYWYQGAYTWQLVKSTGSSITSLYYGENYLTVGCANGHVYHGAGDLWPMPPTIPNCDYGNSSLENIHVVIGAQALSRWGATRTVPRSATTGATTAAQSGPTSISSAASGP